MHAAGTFHIKQPPIGLYVPSPPSPPYYNDLGPKYTKPFPPMSRFKLIKGAKQVHQSHVQPGPIYLSRQLRQYTDKGVPAWDHPLPHLTSWIQKNRGK